MVLSTPNSRLLTFLLLIRVVFYRLTVSKTSNRCLNKVALQKLLPPMSMTKLLMIQERLGKILTIVSSLLDGVKMLATNGGLSETHMDKVGVKVVISL